MHPFLLVCHPGVPDVSFFVVGDKHHSADRLFWMIKIGEHPETVIMQVGGRVACDQRVRIEVKNIPLNHPMSG